MKTLLSIFLTVCSIALSLPAKSQSVDELIEFADLKFEQQQYRLAAREYQRALFFGPKQSVGRLNIRTGDCYFKKNDYTMAEKYYRFASSIIAQDSLKAEAILKKSACNIFSHQYQLAIFDLLNLNTVFSKTLEKNKNLLLGIAYFGTADFDRSETAFAKSVDPPNIQKLDSLRSLFENKKLHRPKPNVAFWMSVVVPGSGQFYSGDLKNGINSLALSLGLMYLAVRVANATTILDALLTVIPWWQRYYMGGYNSAKRIATAKRAKNRSHIYSEIYQLLYN